MHMPRTTVNIDAEALDGARDALGTEGTSQTVNEALREVRRRKALADFDVLRDIDGTPEEVAAGRASRIPLDPLDE
jgi:Arc/MetJ family transcription regulator